MGTLCRFVEFWMMIPPIPKSEQRSRIWMIRPCPPTHFECKCPRVVHWIHTWLPSAQIQTVLTLHASFCASFPHLFGLSPLLQVVLRASFYCHNRWLESVLHLTVCVRPPPCPLSMRSLAVLPVNRPIGHYNGTDRPASSNALRQTA